MTDKARHGALAGAPAKPRLSKRIWKKVRVYLAESRFVANGLGWLILGFLHLVKRTNRLVHDDSAGIAALLDAGQPLIFTCWHGQHFMFPVLRHRGEPSAIMVSRSRDAELNAIVLEKAGVKPLRGSGGRQRDLTGEKGGAKALIGLGRELRDGRSVGFVADIPKGTPREASMGTVTLARISGSPVVPTAYATSRRKVFEKAWDKAALNLPFGKSALVLGEPIYVDRDADDKAMEDARQLLQTRLNEITQTAYAAVDGN